jgi:hypothetical protein
MYNWFCAYAIPAIACGISTAFSKDAHIEYPKQSIYSNNTSDSEDTEDRELQMMIINEQKWAAQAEKRGLPPTIL